MADSLYVHIPFCLRKCRYCDFYSVLPNDKLVDDYLDAIKKEIFLKKKYIYTLKTIYIGGGTPTVIPSVKLLSLLCYIINLFDIDNKAEITIEVNPSTVHESLLIDLKSVGINRISVGIQSFIDKELFFLGRLHNASQAKTSIEIGLKYFNNISIDLIYGLPGQSLLQWEKNIQTTLNFGIKHISAYELTVEPSTTLHNNIDKGIYVMPGEETVAKMFETTIDSLCQNGFIHYEISNYSLPGFQCQHNKNYWQRGQYVGVGAAAHSFINGKRYGNFANIQRYIKFLNENKLPIENSYTVTKEEAVNEQIFLGLRTSSGIPASLFPSDNSQINELISKGFLIKTNENNLFLTKIGLLISNLIILKLMEIND